ncbi:resolvase-like protein [Enterobacter sp. BIGb0383]|uniref:hypothetical protein n=1 Tax=unclassified Enterobacter TaxID=2608935 RepID=UPI000F9D55AD|nr:MULTISPECIES: hypothetical protein [unclassified Enterobacter]ROP49875.1 resolvase-like protein [Enterobacter sp. BIGb0383]ROS06383.1 resolvase-like protein [Enterobacter sp. BIGb0359]
MKIFAYIPKNDECDLAKIALNHACQTVGFKIDRIFEELVNDSITGFESLLSLAQPGDVILVYRMIGLIRLPKDEWLNLQIATEAGVNIAALNLKSTLHCLHALNPAERLAARASTNTLMELTEGAINFIQTSPEFAKRQSPPDTEIKSAAGRPVDSALHYRISVLLLSGASYSDIQKEVNCGRSTISKVKQSLGKLDNAL